MQQIDFFICHASEDKPDFVRPLAHYLVKNGASLFYDEFSLKLGDSLSEAINRGLTQCKCAIVVLSEHFFAKPWTNAELQGIFQRHIADKTKLIILYHQIAHDDVLERLPLLSDIYAADTSLGIPEVSKLIFEAVNFSPSLKYLTTELGESLSNISSDGFSCSLSFQINVLSDRYIDKYLVEYGNPESPFGRVSIQIRANKFLVGTVVDMSGRSISLQTSLDPFTDKQQMLTFQLSAARRALEMYVGGNLVSEFSEISKQFLDDFTLTGRCIFFNSFELVHPTPMTLLFYATGKEFLPGEVLNLSERVLTTVNEFEK